VEIEDVAVDAIGHDETYIITGYEFVKRYNIHEEH
jgi:hypothetical protein